MDISDFLTAVGANTRVGTAREFASEDVDATENTITITGHGRVTGDGPVRVGLTGDGTLPAGLSASTNYFVIVVDEDTIKLATSAANAAAGTAVDITGTGTDTAPFEVFPTMTALANAMQDQLDQRLTNAGMRVCIPAENQSRFWESLERVAFPPE